MLVVDGAGDYFIPRSDALAFQGRPRTEVHLIEETGHVATSKAPQVAPQITGWQTSQFASAR